MQPQAWLPVRTFLVAAVVAGVAGGGLTAAELPAGTTGDAGLWQDVEEYDGRAIAAHGQRVLPRLAAMYRGADEGGRAKLAAIFYQLSWKSDELRELLLADLDTEHETLRLRVQWALGRVSNDDQVVDALLEKMTSDPNPLFRDKAGCGLAYDQVHLTEAQRVRLYGRLIDLLASDDQLTRSLAIRVLHAHTGQYKGYHPNLAADQRHEGIERWRVWLEEYEAQLD